MVKFIGCKDREEEILDFVIESYIKESQPISSTYLCRRYHLPYSSATVRNVMEALEKKGWLSHVHISSGRVPTKNGFKHYVEHLKEEDFIKQEFVVDLYPCSVSRIDNAISYILDVLAQTSGYISLVAISGEDEGVFFRGTRFMLQQPEFEDITRLRNLFYTLEVKLNEFQHLLFDCIGEKIKILIGDEIGFKEIADCSLVVSGTREKDLSLAFALLGPMRMDYVKAASCLYSNGDTLYNFLRGKWL